MSDARRLEVVEGAVATGAGRPRQIPAQGRNPTELLGEMRALAASDAAWREGRVFCLVYDGGEAHEQVLRDAHGLFFAENGLNPMAFKSLKRMEGDVVRMTAALLHGGPDAVGTMSSGGTESILLAVKTYRDRARRLRPWIRRPEMVLPRSAHVAFLKAAELFGVRARIAPLRDDYRVDVRAVERLCNRNTVMIVGSAPQYVQGVIDPIEELGRLARKRKIPLHVDACVGGFLLPWLERLGHPLPAWDFRVPGVTSISADLHKYGYAAKGASTIVYRSMDYLKDQFFVATDWPGGIYASPSLPGTRPGGPIAAAWAALQSLGEEGYLARAGQALEAVRRFREGVQRIASIGLIGAPDATVVSFGSTDPEIDIYAVADQLEDRGWHFDRQQSPASLHLTLMPAHLQTIDAFLADLGEAVETVRSNPELKSRGNAAMYGMVARLPVRRLVGYSVRKIMEDMYGPGGGDEAGLPGEGGATGSLIDRYGARVLGALDRLDALKAKISRRRP